jgi:hypothetical protein
MSPNRSARATQTHTIVSTAASLPSHPASPAITRTFEKHNGDGVTAGHRLAVLWDFSLESEGQGNRCGQHSRGIHDRGDAERARSSQVLIEAILDESADRRANQRACHIEPFYHPV